MDDRQKEFISFMYWKACVDAVNDMEKEKEKEKWERVDEDDWEKNWVDEDVREKNFLESWENALKESYGNRYDSSLVKQQVEQKKQEREKKKKERERIENLLIQSIPMPEKPERKMEKNDKIAMGFGIVCWCAMVFWAIDGAVFFAVIEFFGGIWLVCDASKHAERIYKEKMADYELAQRDFPQYQRMMYERQKAEAKKQKKS